MCPSGRADGMARLLLRQLVPRRMFASSKNDRLNVVAIFWLRTWCSLHQTVHCKGLQVPMTLPVARARPTRSQDRTPVIVTDHHTESSPGVAQVKLRLRTPRAGDRTILVVLQLRMLRAQHQTKILTTAASTSAQPHAIQQTQLRGTKFL